MVHHSIAKSTDSHNKHKYHVFAVAEYPIFGSKHQHINTNIGIPLGPLSLEVRERRPFPLHLTVRARFLTSPQFAGQIDVRAEYATRLDQITVNVKYPLLASVKAGTFKGDLHHGHGVHMAIGVPEVYGTIRLWVHGGDCDGYHPHAWLWVEFHLHVFNVEYKGKFAVLPIP